MSELLICNAQLVLETKVCKGSLRIRDQTLVEVISSEPGKIVSSEARELDVAGMFVAPGFVDLQVNGGVGHNFGDVSSKKIQKTVDFHVAHGTTGLLATTVTAPIESIRDAIGRVHETKHPAILGMHIEGPFISPNLKGAQNPGFILKPTVEKLDELVRGYENFVQIVTVAPELPEAERLVSRIREIGAVPSLGHSDASYEEALAAVGAGVRLFTHLGNAMRGLQQREPGAVGAALDSDAYVELICDGVHLHPAFVRLVAKVKGFDRICLVTDAISAAGLSDGEYSLGGLPVFVQNGIARLSDGTLAGSTLTMNRAVRTFMEFTGCSLPEGVRCATLNPARLVGIADRKGSIAVGKDADLVIFDDDFNVCYTLLGGTIVYARSTKR